MSEHIFDRQRWQHMSIFEQMGNIGSEVGRAMAAKRRGDNVRLEGALWRGLDLFDATVEGLARQHSPRTYEVLRARELFVESVTTENEDASLENYFTQFALAARLHRFDLSVKHSDRSRHSPEYKKTRTSGRSKP